MIGGVEDHVHVVASVPPTVALSTFVGKMKGVSSANTNKSQGPDAPRFSWQGEYGAFTVDAKRLPYVIAYVAAKGTPCRRTHHSVARTDRR